MKGKGDQGEAREQEHTHWPFSPPLNSPSSFQPCAGLKTCSLHLRTLQYNSDILHLPSSSSTHTDTHPLLSEDPSCNTHPSLSFLPALTLPNSSVQLSCIHADSPRDTLGLRFLRHHLKDKASVNLAHFHVGTLSSSPIYE